MEALDPERISATAQRIRPWLAPTPVWPYFDDPSVQFKLELLQPTGSFKVRGYFAAALALPKSVLARGLLTVSAGNAGIACAYVAHQLGVRCRVIMVEDAPRLKVERVREWGGEAVLWPRRRVFEWMAEEGWRQSPENFLHPHLDLEMMAGHGTCALELMEQMEGLERVVVAVGGGGLVSGLAAALGARRPEIEIVGVQSDGYALWPAAIAAGGRVDLAPHTIADGTVAPYHPAMMDRLESAVDRWLVVPEARLHAAVRELALAARIVAEGSGALPLAALEQLEPGPKTALIVSGGNIDAGLLSSLLEEGNQAPAID
ncbi:MAG TPA: pyridoxal-phosphate dependent enzyme [Candidatus Acidoferrales bacterium]|nr:pyridoxal-phosphate dependent enzyme [Candidatus Acidoferrales bacterium]